ncbi:MAG: hypothetical protein DRO93_09285 [Candidatus Thorarchaeota archaeon]|nr:MAG: hypothetical protein DRO93_09285 [Candidatus Thorarchaeota archaeon]
MKLSDNPIIPEFAMYSPESDELDEIAARLADPSRTANDRFRAFTDVLADYVATSEWKNHSKDFLSMLARACYLRGMYGYNQVLAKDAKNLTCKGYAAASYCRQSLDPRWLNNLQNIVNQAWQANEYIAYAELAGTLAQILVELGYTDRAREVAMDSIERAVEASKHDEVLKRKVTATLLDAHIVLAHIASLHRARDEAIIRLDSAQNTAERLDDQLALAKILHHRALVMFGSHEYDTALALVTTALRKFESMGYLDGVANARNLRGVLYLHRGEFQDARDQFEELMLIQQQLNNQVGLAKALVNIGEIDRALGQLEQMEIYNRKALEISQEAEYMRGIVTATINLGDVALRRGQIAQAIEQYVKGAGMAERAGMKSTAMNAYFLTGDAYCLKQEHSKAVDYYRRAKEFAKNVSFPLDEFLADVSILVALWGGNMDVPPELLSHIADLMGKTSDWLGSGTTRMTLLRRRIFEDDTIQSDRCIFFNSELNFECRVERTTMRKECYGSLTWMGGLCPHFRRFMQQLDQLR